MKKGKRIKVRQKILGRVMILALMGTMFTSKPAMAYTENELFALSHIISAEGGNCGYWMLVSIGSVVLNRVTSPLFPNTIEGVVFQEGQYAPTWDGSYWNEPTPEAVEVAKMLLEEGSKFDESVIWQAEFPQGNGIYDTIESPWGTVMYFCF